ncbi:hypothetical protein ACTJKC_02725 [Pedobacter sp. 22226]|uniref:hypothetical protein n=1 Tax=Pedobacter sp. 22226 TaxID=3453894 RepID=UPI003F864F9C
MLDLAKFTDLELIDMFIQINREFKRRQLTRSGNFTGDYGENIALKYFSAHKDLPNLVLEKQGNQHVDARDGQGNRYAIKTITGKTTGVFYGLNPPKSLKPHKIIFDYVVIVKLDKNFLLEKVLLLDWSGFILNMGWHKTMKAYNLTLGKKLEQYCKIYYGTPIVGRQQD